MSNIIKCKDFVSDKLIFPKIQEGNNQYISYPKYSYRKDNCKENQLMFQTPWIINSISVDDMFKMTGNDRYVVIALNGSNDDSNDLKNMLLKIENEIKLKKNIIFDAEDNDTYQSFIPIVEHREDLENITKFKFKFDPYTGEMRTIFKYQSKNSNKLESLNIEDGDDLRKYFVKGCQIRMIVTLDKIYFSKHNQDLWGTVFSIIRMDIK